MGGYKISIVEDDEITGLNLKLTLTKQDYNIVSVSINVTDGFEAIVKERPDLAIIDISLESSDDGIDLAKKVRQELGIPFIFLTSHSSNDIIAKAKEAKPSGYILKPFVPNSIHAAIEMALFQFQEQKKETLAQKPLELSVENLLKKHSLNNTTISFCNGYIFNIVTEELFYNTEKIALKPTETALMKKLLSKMGVVVEFDELQEYIAQQTGENVTIRSLVWRLKNRLETEVIQSISEVGYFIEE